MKNSNKLFVILTFFSVLTLAACGSSSGGGGNSGAAGGSTSGLTDGTITLTGLDSGTVGDQLDTGFIGSSLAAAGQPDHIVIVDQASIVSFTPPNILIPTLDDPANGFVLVVNDDSASGGSKWISMSILVSGVKYDFVCITPAGVYMTCGDNTILLDIGSRTVTLNNVTTENKDGGAVLTLNGSLTW